ncbi:MAG: hypothetical protein QM817_39600 [Archangium sp.]
MKYVINGVLVALVLVAGALAWKLRGRGESPTAPLPVVPAPEKCDEANKPLPPLRPELSAARLEVLGARPVKIDGQTPGATLRAGLHIIESDEVKLQVQVEPFAEVVIEATSIGEVPLLLVFGATCVTCARSETDLDLKFSKSAFGSADSLARALGKNDWATAAQQIRAVPPDDRATPQMIRMIAAAHLLAGRGQVARELISTLPKSDALPGALNAADDRSTRVGDRQLATASDRWNAVSERYQRLSDAFVNDAPRQVTELSNKFNGYSERMLKAVTSKDALEAEIVLHEAGEAVRATVAQLRAMKSDCAWQKRIWQAL